MITFEEVLKLYHENDVCIGDLMTTISADGHTLDSAFDLYIRLRQYIEGDKFFQQCGDNYNGDIEEILPVE